MTTRPLSWKGTRSCGAVPIFVSAIHLSSIQVNCALWASSGTRECLSATCMYLRTCTTYTGVLTAGGGCLGRVGVLVRRYRYGSLELGLIQVLVPVPATQSRHRNFARALDGWRCSLSSDGFLGEGSRSDFLLLSLPFIYMWLCRSPRQRMARGYSYDRGLRWMMLVGL